MQNDFYIISVKQMFQCLFLSVNVQLIFRKFIKLFWFLLRNAKTLPEVASRSASHAYNAAVVLRRPHEGGKQPSEGDT